MSKTISICFKLILCMLWLLLLLPSNRNIMSLEKLVFTSWNAHGINTAHAYLCELLDRSDLVVINEHWLPRHELYKLNFLHNDFQSTATSGQCVGYDTTHAWGGVAILWRKTIDFNVKVLNVDNNRICVICIYQKHCKDIYLIGVYLPHVACKGDSFVDVLLVLEELIIKYQQCGHLLVMGDLNCHFGPEVGIRGSGKTSRQAKLLLSATQRNSLTVVDMGPICQGPNYTFFSENIGQSYIDHCIVSNELVENVLNCTVHSDTIENTSDHLALSVELKLINVITPETPTPCNSGIAWYKLSQCEIQELYTDPVESTLSVYLANKMYVCNAPFDSDFAANVSDIEDLLQTVVKTMTECSSKLPKKGFNKSFKPYWTHNLKCLSKRKKRIMEIWRLAGRPRNKENVIWCEYKFVKREFRREQRKSMYEYEIKNMKEFAEHSEIDVKYFWHLVNLSRKIKNKTVSPVRLDDNSILTEKNDIKNAWSEHFRKIFSPDNHKDFDKAWFEHVNNEMDGILYETYGKQSVLFDTPFSMTDLKSCISMLKKNKAVGSDGIASEHIKFGGNTLRKCILYIMNSMLHFETMSNSLKKGVLIPIPKKGKDSMLRENNRGITLLCVFYKMYQNLLKERMSQGDDKIDSAQGAGRKGISCLHTSYLLRETIAYNRENDKDVYVCFLDARKAFDTVWVMGLLFKLHDVNIDPKLWRIIKEMYSNFCCTVKINNEYAEWFEISQGVQQGAPLSLWLYEVFVNDLLLQLKKSNMGAKIGGINITCPAYADDIALVAVSPGKLQTLLDIAHAHSKKWRYLYNADKSEVLCFTKVHKHHQFWLGNEKIQTKDKCKHLGTVVANAAKNVEKDVSDAMYRGKQALYSLRGIGSASVPTSTLVMSRLYWSVCVPVITYGCEVTTLSEQSRTVLESGHWEIAKLIQKLPKNVSNPCVLRQVGWINIISFIEMLKLCFLWRILGMSITSVYKQVAVKRILMFVKENVANNMSPTCDILKAARKYDILHIIVQSITSGEFMPLCSFKALIKCKIQQREFQQHVISLNMYKKAVLYDDCITSCTTWPWFVHASKYPETSRKCTTLLRLIVGIEIDCMSSCICSAGYTMTASHVLFECILIKHIGNILWKKVEVALPKGMLKDINEMSPKEKIVFIGSGFRSKYMVEFIGAYNALLDYVCAMNSELKKIVNIP